MIRNKTTFLQPNKLLTIKLLPNDEEDGLGISQEIISSPRLLFHNPRYLNGLSLSWTLTRLISEITNPDCRWTKQIFPTNQISGFVNK